MPDYHFFFSAGSTLLFSFVVALFYYHKFFKRDIAIAVVLYSMLIFAIVFFVSFQSNIGLGLGLLGVLSLIRLRSIPESLVDVGFIFYAITIGLLGASILDLGSIVLIDLLLTFILILLTAGLFFRKNIVKTKITFDEIFFDKLNDVDFLRRKIQKKYSIKAINVRVVNINYLKDSATLEITYDAESN